MKISWILLTYNRKDLVEKSISHNLHHMGDVETPEIIWCDNGSTDGVQTVVQDILRPDVAILNRTNLGVAKGYNRALAMATGDYLVITGCDFLMRERWLEKFVAAKKWLPDGEIFCVYNDIIQKNPERVRGPSFYLETMKTSFCMAMPIGRRFMSREIFQRIGYFPETFGMYGWDDVAWANRAEKILGIRKSYCYAMIDEWAEHLGTEGINAHDGNDPKDYWEFKRQEVVDSKKKLELTRLSALGWPKSSPYCGCNEV